MRTRAGQIRESLKHPVIDGDGHWMEPIPVFLEYLSDVGGAKAVDEMRARWRRNASWYYASAGERQHKRLRRPLWWGVTSNTHDKATALLPALLYERLPELGIDFALIYPTFGLGINMMTGDLQLQAARAYNRMTADAFKPYADRFAPVASIPARTPDDAIAELEYAVTKLGYRAIMLRGSQERPVPAAADGIDPAKAAIYCDNIALDSPYDYDPFWQRCVDLKVAVTQHAGCLNWPNHGSLTNFTYNHIGHFAESNHHFARGVFLGGVARRFPTLNFGFMEGGVAWASQLVNDMTEHWEKRRRAALQHPKNTDVPQLKQFIQRYGDPRVQSNADAIMDNLDSFRPACTIEELSLPEHISDDFDAAGVHTKADIRSVFANQFFYGCEADDRGTMWAFDPRMGVRLRPVFSSDFTHFDVPDFADVLPEAHELVEHGYINPQDFREFTFTNAALLHTRNNPNFFKGTVVERAVADELSSPRGTATVA